MCCTFKGILLTFRDCFTRISTKKWAQIIPFILLGVAKGKQKQKMEDTAGNPFHVSKAATKRSLHPKMYLLFNYHQLLRDGLGWNVAAQRAVAACWLSISLCHLIHSLDSLLWPRESDQSMLRRQGRYITGADETLDSRDTEDSWIVCSSFQTKILKQKCINCSTLVCIVCYIQYTFQYCCLFVHYCETDGNYIVSDTSALL